MAPLNSNVMFALSKLRDVSVLLVICFGLGGCEKEVPKFESAYILDSSCIPESKYYVGLLDYLNAEFQTYNSASDTRPGTTKFRELADLFTAAKEEAYSCHIHSLTYSGTDRGSPSWGEVNTRLLRAWLVSDTYFQAEKSWEDTDVLLFQRALSGEDIEPVLESYMENLVGQQTDDET